MAKKKPEVAAAGSTASGLAVPTGTEVGQTPAPAATPEVAAAPAPAPKPEKPAKVVQNGVTRPGAGSVTGKVWEFADSISGTLKAPAPRGDVMKACEAASINQATAATQYGKWRKFNGLKSEPKVAKVKPADQATPAAAPAASEPAAAAEAPAA